MKIISLFFAASLLLFSSDVFSQRIAVGVRGINLYSVPDMYEPRTYSSFVSVAPTLHEVYVFERSDGKHQYVRFTSIEEHKVRPSEQNFMGKFRWYMRYYHKEKWFIHFDNYRPQTSYLSLNAEQSASPDFDTFRKTADEMHFDFNKTRNLGFGKYVGKPKFGQFYYLIGISHSTIWIKSPDKQTVFAGRIGTGIRYKSIMLEAFIYTSFNKLKSQAYSFQTQFQELEPLVTTFVPEMQLGRYKWLDFSLTLDLVSVPIKSRKRAKEIDEIKNSW